MKKCPECYAIMREYKVPASAQRVQQRSSEPSPELPETVVQFECSQCGHTEQEVAKRAPRR